MKNLRYSVVLFLILVFSGLAMAQRVPPKPDKPGRDTKDKTLSPYFFVKSDDPSIDQLPLKSTAVHVDIAGVIANVEVTQVYKNTGKRPIEAIYIFPASTRAAVYAMKMTIGKRTIIAKIMEREKARKKYEQAKAQGKSASLLEQQRPNVFRMNVANILPGDVIRVELKYTENLVPTDGTYEFVYPTVVGPRYSNAKECRVPKSGDWVSNPYTHQGKKPTYTFDIGVDIQGGMPVADVKCPSHKVNIAFDGPNTATIRLAKAEKFGGNRDFILKYRLKGRKVQSGLLLYHGRRENFFLAMLQPPKRVKPRQIPKREYIFIVDVSGSMNGFPLDISKRLLRELIGSLRPSDRFNVLLFAGTSALMAPRSVRANKKNIKKAIYVINNQHGSGGTELLPAMDRALSLPRVEGVSRTIVILTDGYVTMEKQAFDLIRKKLGRANFFAFGIGSSVNRFLIEGIAHTGMGEPFIVTNPADAMPAARRFRKYILSPVLTSIKLTTPGFDTYDVIPENIPDLFAERPIIVFGKYRGKAKGRMKIHALTARGRFSQVLKVKAFNPQKANIALKYLWARHKIAELSDYAGLVSMGYGRGSNAADLKSKITALGLKYNLLTRYTSFIAIDRRIRLKDGKAVTVKQPLPMPQGVSDLAVGSGTYRGAGGASKDMKFSEAARPRFMKLKPVHRPGLAKALINRPVINKKCRLGKISVDTKGGAMDARAIRRVIHRHLAGIRHCCMGIAKKHGKLMIILFVDKSGRVVKVRLRGRTVFSRIKRCFTKLFSRIRFPASKRPFKIKIIMKY